MIKQILLTLLLALSSLSANAACGESGVWVQVLGSGGPELNDQRASSGYIIWHNGKAKVLVDMGSGSMRNFEKSGGKVNDLEVVLLTHLHVDHSADLPALIKASFFTNRSQNLPIFGPSGNTLMPSTTGFVQTLFGPNGAYRYLSSFLDGSESYTVQPHDINTDSKQEQVILNNSLYQITAVPTHHGPIPAVAWQVKIGDRKIVFSGDMNNDNHTLAHLAAKADLLIAHHAVPESAIGVARKLHMPPSEIGKVARQAAVRQLVLSHRMLRTIGVEEESAGVIKHHYAGPLHFAEDLQCFKP